MYSKVKLAGLSMGMYVLLLCSCIHKHEAESVASVNVQLSLDEMMAYPEHVNVGVAEGKYRYVVYVDSTECSLCMVSHMGLWNYFYNELLAYDACLCYILNPPANKIQELLEAYVFFKQRIPIFVDTLGVFRRDNPQIANGPTMSHCFLLDEYDKVVFTGNASENQHAREKIFEFLSVNEGGVMAVSH